MPLTTQYLMFLSDIRFRLFNHWFIIHLFDRYPFLAFPHRIITSRENVYIKRECIQSNEGLVSQKLLASIKGAKSGGRINGSEISKGPSKYSPLDRKMIVLTLEPMKLKS